MEQYENLLENTDSTAAKYVKVFRGWQKTVTASYRPYLERVSPDGRLRAEYTTHVTSTGRLSCRNPNLQQIPKTTEKIWNGKVKEAFIAKPGFVLINADYSQLELRLATAYAGESHLKKVFAEGRDIFTEIATSLGLERQQAKTLVYSMQYGAGLNRIMNVFNVTKDKAERIRNNYFNTYPRFKVFSDICSRRAEQDGKVKIWTGRYRHFQYRSEGYKAMNSVIQGGAADIVERTMVRLYKEVDDENCRMLAQVHDSVLFEIREDMVEEYSERILAVMTDVDAVTADFDGKFDVVFDVKVEPWTTKE
jgi:DNA polymerase-1